LASFAYSALSPTGKESKGSISADSREDALAKLKASGVTVISLSEAGMLNREVSVSFLQKKPKPREMAIFCRQMVSILSAGVTMTDALMMLEEQTENKLLREAINGCRLQIEGGSSLADAMSQYKVFPSIFCTMIAAGEESGSLEMSFERSAERFEKDAKLQALIKKATIYPIVVAVVAVIVVIAMLAFVVPKFEDILGSLGTELPGITKAVVATSHFVQNHIVLILIVIISLVVGLKFWNRTDSGRHILDSIKLRAPLFGKLTIKTACANMARTLSTLLASGVAMLDAIEITSNTMGNIHFKEALMEIKSEVAVGTEFSEALRNTRLFPPLVYHMAGIGEQTGDLVGMYSKIADYYDEEVQQTTEQVMAALEPLIIVVLAGIVGTIVISLILPMASMYGALENV